MKIFTKIKYLFFGLLWLMSEKVAAQAATIGGEVYELIPGGESIGLPFAAVILWQNGEMIDGKTTDYNGRYRFEEVAAGDYILQISQLGRQTFEKNISLYGGQAIYFKTELPRELEEISADIQPLLVSNPCPVAKKKKTGKAKLRHFLAKARPTAPAVVGTVVLAAAYYSKTKAMSKDMSSEEKER